jgi:membrane protein implicated in regulation of membrane protease activity
MLTGALVIVALGAFVALALTFFVARRALRLFVRLAVIAVVAILLLSGYVWWRWRAPTERSTPARSNERRQSTPARR